MDPFFSTKRRNGNTGLGLSVSMIFRAMGERFFAVKARIRDYCRADITSGEGKLIMGKFPLKPVFIIDDEEQFLYPSVCLCGQTGSQMS